MAESEEEPEQPQSEAIESSNDENKVVIVLNKPPNARNHQGKQSNIIVRQITNKRPKKDILNLTKDSKQKSVKEEKDEEIDFIVLEELSQDAVENSQKPVEKENDETEQCSSKRMRLDIEQTIHKSNESIQPEKVEEIVVQKPAARIAPDVIVARKSTDGIVSSTETVDANNEETYFALSLVGILKRLPPHKRAIAKCHILSYLTELEYGSTSI